MTSVTERDSRRSSQSTSITGWATGQRNGRVRHMSLETHHYRATVLRTALAGCLLFLVPAPLVASDIAPYTQLQDAPEGELIGLLDQVANARTSSETRAAAAAAVAKLLERGHTDAVTDRALETLGALGAPQGGRMLAQYTHHRRPAARARAYAALGK